MPSYAYVVNDSPVSLWGLTSCERLKRMITRIGNVTFLQDLHSLPRDSSVLILRGDFLYDDRILKRLAKEENTLLQVSLKNTLVPVAAVVTTPQALQAEAILTQNHSAKEIPNIQTVQMKDWSSGFQEQLRKFDPPYIYQSPKTDSTIWKNTCIRVHIKG